VRASDLAGLAPVHGQVLALRAAGFSAEAIAAIVGVAVESVPVLIEVAARKRANQVHIPNPKETTR